MLPKNKRISRRLFPLLRKAKIFKNQLFLLKLTSSPSKESRFAFSVSKKIAKKAILRNKCRRWGYRTIQPLLPQIKSQIMAQFSFLKVPKDSEEVSENLYAILKTSKLLKS